jgi:glucokinase
MILAGDIGGTKTRLAAFDINETLRAPKFIELYQSSRYSSLEEIVSLFLEKYKVKVEVSCFGFAGTVRQGQAVATNLPWILNVKDLAGSLQTNNVWLINDLEANAFGIEVLPEEDFCTINVGELDEHGNAGLISAGTGLGEAGLFFDGKRLQPFASEGGHCDFAPKDQEQFELLTYLQARYGNVSWERVLSGTGLFNIYTFLRDTGRGKEPDWLAAEILEGDSAASISRAALAGTSELCDKALTMFISFYGAEAGNLALKLMATAGIYIGGGIAPKIVERMKTPLFMESFASKGRLQRVLRRIPVHIILNDKTALLGAAQYARTKAEIQCVR